MHAPGTLEEVKKDLLRPIRFLKPESYRNFYIDMHIYISFLLLHSLLRTPHYMLELPIP